MPDLEVREGRNRVGRKSANELHVQHSTAVSSLHAEIIAEPGRIVLRDLRVRDNRP